MTNRAAATRLRGRRSLFALVVAWLIVLVYATGILLTIWLEDRLHGRDDPLLEDALLIAGFGALPRYISTQHRSLARRAASGGSWGFLSRGFMIMCSHPSAVDVNRHLPGGHSSGVVQARGIQTIGDERLDLARDITRGEMVVAEIDALIRRRDTHRLQTEGERLEEELYEPSVRAWRERQEAEKRADRFEYHRGRADRLRRTMGEFVAYHESEAERYLQAEPKGAA